MSAQENKELIQRVSEEVFSKGNLDVIDRYFAPNWVMHDAPSNAGGNRQGLKEVLGVIRGGFPDARASIDLILGLPLQTRDSFQDSLDEAIAAGVGHVSLYMLDLEDGTSLQRQVADGRAALPDDEVVAELYLMAIDRLAAAGFEQYEISNFARAGEECRHNLRYWRRGEYHGFGAGAHSFIDGRRFANARDVRQYIEQAQPDFAEVLNEIDVKRETIFLRLRQVAGIDYDEVAQLCGQEGIEWMEHGVSEGWLRRMGSRVAFTPSGFLVSNELISQLF